VWPNSIRFRKWIDHPETKLGTGVDPDTLRRYVEKKWAEDIARNQAYVDVITGILIERSS